MTIFDYAVLGIFVLSMIIGLVTGFMKQLLGILGLGAVVGGTYFLYEIPKGWFSGMADGFVLDLIAMAVTAIVLLIVWSIISKFISKLVRKIKILKIVDAILGGILGIAFVYCFVAIVVGALQVDIELIQLVKDLLGSEFDNSWFVNTIYETNPLGDIVGDFLRQLPMPI